MKKYQNIIILIGLSLFILSSIAFQNSQKKETSSKEIINTSLNTSLDYIKASTNEKGINNDSVLLSSGTLNKATNTGTLLNKESFLENKKNFKEEIDGIKNLIIYDGRTQKNKGVDIQKYFNDNFGVKIGAINTVGVYQTTFISGNDEKSLKTLKKWFFGIYQNNINQPDGITSIVIGDNWEEIIPKLLYKSLNNDN